MGREHLIEFADRFKRVLSAQSVNALGRLTRYCHRERVITPHRMAMSLLASCARGRVQTLADLQRDFNALFGTSVAYKPFHNQLAKRQFADFMRELACKVIERWTVRVLEAQPGGAFSEFGRILIQDGSSFAVHDALSKHYPGRFRPRSPAAVELHVTMDLLRDCASKITLAADTAPERPYLPRAHTLKGDLLLADRGYFSLDYLREVDAAGGSYVIRGKTSLNPVVQAGYGAGGRVLRGVRGKRLGELRKKGLLDFDVAWGQGDKEFQARLIVSWNRSKGQYRYLVTNLPRDRYTPEAVDQACRLRWQIELLFKEWKSYASLHAFNTANPAIAEGLIRAAVAAAAMKRYLAHMTQVLRAVEVSTRKVAMCAHHVLTDLFRVLTSQSHGDLHETLRAAIEYLANNATRAHPKRERRTGRLQFGIVPILDIA